MESLQIGELTVSTTELAHAVSGVSPEEFLEILRSMVAARKNEQLKLLLDGLEIQATLSAFRVENRDNIAILEKVAATYPLTRWLEEMGVDSVRATRTHLCQWWDTMVLMASEHGYQSHQVSASSKSSHLWKATGPLAGKMQADPKKYLFLPALLANHEQEVVRVLGEISEPEAFLEVLIGERIEDIRTSPAFLGAFSFVKDKDGKISRSTADALWSVHMTLQRS